MSTTPNGANTSMSPSIQITSRKGRSTYMFLLQHLIKPTKSRLITPKKDYLPGSPKLEAPKKTRKHCEVHERIVEDVYIYDLYPRIPRQSNNTEKSQGRPRRLYYFCGGGWRMPPSPQHWPLCTEFAMRLPDTRISIVSYPLSPNSPAPTAFPQLMRMYARILDEAEKDGETVILGGDSSGGNIVLSLALARLAESESGPQPTAVVAICPSVDLRKTNPDMKPVEKHDPILTIPFVTENARKWHGDWDASDPRVTPLLADVSSLARRGVKVHGVSAGYDVLCPDAILFRDKCQKAGVKGEWLHWEKQMHCWPLAWTYKLPESVQAKDWILDVLERI